MHWICKLKNKELVKFLLVISLLFAVENSASAILDIGHEGSDLV